jgi:hypothetical protein
MYDSIQFSKATSSRRTSQVTRRKKLHSLIGGLQPAAPLLAGRIAIPLLLLSVGLILVQPSAGQSGTWTETGNLAEARRFHTATLLPNGKVLAACGDDGFSALTSAELYDPTSGTWTVTGSLATGRIFYTATLLPYGKVLVAGGQDIIDIPFASAELYDSATGTWTATGKLVTARHRHAAALLPNGMVLVAGGYDSDFSILTSAELYDPVTETWTSTGSLNAGRAFYTATLLPNGMVLVAGGIDSDGGSSASAELYDPASGTWTTTGSLDTGRDTHTATLLPNGQVLVAAGYNRGVLASAELYDPASGTWTVTGSLATERWEHTATLLPNGKVLVAGGRDFGVALASAELYDPASGTWSAPGNLDTARYAHTATLLPDGKVLVAGGDAITSGPFASAELYLGPATAPTLLNISTRMRVLTGDQVLFGGFMITGSDPDRVLIRAIGPSLSDFGAPEVLANPTLELHSSDGSLIGTNDDWKSLQQADIEATGLQPTNDLESAILATLDPGPYTAIVKGKDGSTGVGLIEAYDLDESAGEPPNSKLANISARGFVDTADNVMIGGFILGAGSAAVIVRAIGPSLISSGVAGPLQDPTLQLHDANGVLIQSNDNWRSDQEAEIIATNLPPPNDLESAIVLTLTSGAYTSIVRGKDDTSGVGLVEIYNLQ